MAAYTCETRSFSPVTTFLRSNSSQRDHPTPAATAIDTRSRGCGFAALAGSEVRITEMVRVAGSAHASVPVEPAWPKVFSEQPLLPAVGPMFQPRPRGATPPGL